VVSCKGTATFCDFERLPDKENSPATWGMDIDLRQRLTERKKKNGLPESLKKNSSSLKKKPNGCEE